MILPGVYKVIEILFVKTINRHLFYCCQSTIKCTGVEPRQRAQAGTSVSYNIGAS